ncbi:MAG: trehalose-phosphatase [Acidimicrobiales bacterium]|nr:trehalose-phosphatase [Acidimicrobiales bacterium]
MASPSPGPDSSPDGDPSPELRRAVEPLLVDPRRSAVICDYDGTLSPIVEDPEAARPLVGTVGVLARLARGFGVVAVVSGRPLPFLLEQLRGVPDTVRLAGLYGLEQRGPGGTRIEPSAEPWASVVRAAATRLRADAPEGILVEDKRLGVTVHWRTVPEAAPWGVAAARHEAERTGLRPQEGKMSVELRVPLEVDKGTTIAALSADAVAVCYFGDDLGDLPAFATLRRLGHQPDRTGVSVAVTGPETPGAVIDAADMTVPGPAGALALLGWMAAQAAPEPGPPG